MIRHPGVPFVLFAFAVLCAVILGAMAIGVQADYVVLTNGRTLQGEITEANDQVVRVKMSGGVVTLPRSSVESIHRGEAKPVAEKPAEKGRERVAHQGEGGAKPGVFRYLDGTDAETGEVTVTRFSVLKPVGELAHGTLIEVLETATVNGLSMAKIRAGKLEGWVPAKWLRDAAEETVLRK